MSVQASRNNSTIESSPSGSHPENIYVPNSVFFGGESPPKDTE